MPDAPGSRTPAAVTVSVVAICGADHLRRCLGAVAAQEGVPPFDTIVAYDPALLGIEAVARDHPSVRFVSNAGQRTPLELASRAIREASGDVILLTEDHCIPDADWVARMVEGLADGYAAAGGLVTQDGPATGTDFAFYFVDYFRYTEPAELGPSPTLTVCNVAYRRRDLEQISDPPWRSFFHETAVNTALSAKFGPLRLVPRSRVAMNRHVRFVDAVRERYAFGRLFGATRLIAATPGQRAAYRLLGPALPPLLMGRMIGKALKSRRLTLRLVRGFGPLTIMVLAWSLGEWLGYLTGKAPADLTVAPEADRRNVL